MHKELGFKQATIHSFQKSAMLHKVHSLQVTSCSFWLLYIALYAIQPTQLIFGMSELCSSTKKWLVSYGNCLKPNYVCILLIAVAYLSMLSLNYGICAIHVRYVMQIQGSCKYYLIYQALQPINLHLIDYLSVHLSSVRRSLLC